MDLAYFLSYYYFYGRRDYKYQFLPSLGGEPTVLRKMQEFFCCDFISKCMQKMYEDCIQSFKTRKFNSLELNAKIAESVSIGRISHLSLSFQ